MTDKKDTFVIPGPKSKFMFFPNVLNVLRLVAVFLLPVVISDYNKYPVISGALGYWKWQAEHLAEVMRTPPSHQRYLL